MTGRGFLFALLVGAGLARTGEAARFIAAPVADALPEGRWSAWQFALYEARSTSSWRGLTRFDVGLPCRFELGVLVIEPPTGATDTWLNLQWQAVKEEGPWPSVAAGVWDLARRGEWLSNARTGPSPFAAVSKTVWKEEGRFLKLGLAYGFNRLTGAFGGLEGRWGDTGLLVEYAPENLRLSGADAWDVGLYHWVLPSWRVRASWMGGNPMVDMFWTHQFGVVK